jgi:DNA-binding HxlR family transcriptional regulator
VQYDHNVDNFAIKELGKTSACSYRELKRQIEKRLRRTLSFDVYDLHIRKMVKARILRKHPARRRGSKILYSLSNAAKEQIPLKLIAHPKFHSRSLIQNFGVEQDRRLTIL